MKWVINVGVIIIGTVIFNISIWLLGVNDNLAFALLLCGGSYIIATGAYGLVAHWRKIK